MTVAVDTQNTALPMPADLASAPCAGQAAPAGNQKLPLASGGVEGLAALSLPEHTEHAGRPAAGPGDVPLDWITAEHFGGGNAGRNAKRRWLVEVAALVTYDGAGRKRLPPDTLLAGEEVKDVLRGERAARFPNAAKQGTDAHRRREILNRTIDEAYACFCRERHLARTDRQSEKTFKRERGPWLAELFQREGMWVGTSRNTLIQKRNRIVDNKPTDGRYRSGRRRGVLFDPEIFADCAALYTTSPMDLTGGHSIFAWGQARAAKQGREWKGSPQRFRELMAESVTKPERVLGREGGWAHEGRCLPKMKRPCDRVPCGKGGSLDNTPDDVFVQGIGRDGRPHPIRLDIAGVAYYDSTVVVLETGRSESADLTMRLLRRVYADDILEELDTDWGSGFTRAVGKRRGVLADPLMAQVQRLTERYGTHVDQKPVRKAWLKPVESFWAQKKRIDRQHEFYIGETEEEKKIAWKYALANVHRLPTPAARAAEIQQLAELHNNTSRPALGGTPNDYHKDHRGEIRRPDLEELEFLCSVFIGTRIVRASGVALDGLPYGALQEDVYGLQGRKVFVWRPTEEKPPFLWLRDKNGHKLAIADCSRLECATLEDVARTESKRSRLKRLDQEVIRERRFLLKGRRGQVTQTMHERRLAEAEARRRAEPAAEEPPVKIVTTGLGESVRQAKKRHERSHAKRVLGQAATGNGSGADSDPAQTGLDLLLAAGRQRPEPEAETECLADRLVRFNHAG
jgi:hypothetical protein